MFFDKGGGAVETVIDLILLGQFIKMGRFDKTVEGFRKASVSHGKTCADI
jgi:hypothetical protein